jgi:hypothetical protein
MKITFKKLAALLLLYYIAFNIGGYKRIEGRAYKISIVGMGI